MKMRAVASFVTTIQDPPWRPEKRSREDRFLKRLVAIYNLGMHGDVTWPGMSSERWKANGIEATQAGGKTPLGGFLSSCVEVIRPDEPHRLMTSINKDLMRLFS
jgi:hypothetical protein